jgi:hypothetical protein
MADEAWSRVDNYIPLLAPYEAENFGKLHRYTKKVEQGGTEQPATRSESKSKGGDKPQPEAEGRSR